MAEQPSALLTAAEAQGADARPDAEAPAPSFPTAPYPGLRPFEEDEWPIFFGREKILHEVIERLTVNQLVVVHGSSGCGKSSFVRAGVLARLKQECAREGLNWQTAPMRPGNSPLWNLATAIASIENKGTAEPTTAEIRTIRQQLNLGRKAFASIAQHLALGPDHQACILLDQFEELFRYAREIGLDEAEAFVDVICGFAAAPPEGLHLIATIRSDHLGDCAQFHGLAEMVVNKNQYLLPRVSDSDLLRAIREPAKLFKGEVEVDLAMRLLRDSEGEMDALPLIQHGLMRMWQQVEGGSRVIELSQYQGLRQGLSTHADEIVDTIVARQDSPARQDEMRVMIEVIFSALTSVDGNGRYIRSQQTFGQLKDLTGLDNGTLNDILRPFRARSTGFLTPYGTADIADDMTIVDISHEALIRHWEKLSGTPMDPGWTHREAEDGQRYRALLELVPGPLPRQASRRWIAWWKRRPSTPAWAARYGGRFDQAQLLLKKTERRQKIRQIGGFAFGFVLLLSAAGAAFLVGQWKDSQARAALEERERLSTDRLAAAQTARANSLARIGEQLLVRDGPTRGLLVGLEGLNGVGGDTTSDPNEKLPIVPQTQRLVYRALQELRERFIVPGRRLTAPVVSFSPNANLLSIGRGGGNLQIMDIQTGVLTSGPTIVSQGLMGMRWINSDGGSRLMLLGQEGLFSVVPCITNAGNADIPQCAPGSTPRDDKVIDSSDSFRAVSPDGRLAISGGNSRQTRLWDLRERREVSANLPQFFNATFNGDGTQFALAIADRIRVYNTSDLSFHDLEAGELATAARFRFVALAFGPTKDGKLFSARNGVARLWNLQTGKSEELPRAAANTFQAVFSPAGDSVAASIENGIVQVWHWPKTGGPAITYPLQGHAGLVLSLDFSRDGQWIATGANDGTARVWRLHGLLQAEVTKEPDTPTEKLEGTTNGTMTLDVARGLLQLRDQAGQEPIVIFNRKRETWKSYGFAPGRVVAITEDGRKYSWKLFANVEELATFARGSLPLCGGKPVALLPRERSILLGLSDSSRDEPQSGNKEAPTPEEGAGNDPELNCGSRRPDAEVWSQE